MVLTPAAVAPSWLNSTIKEAKMSELPEPLTPADCDLRGMEWMPLYGDRLLSSETWLEAGPEGRCAALALWWASWKQCPAGSLANTDRVLCQIAGYGMAIKSWLAIKDEAMRGWVKCSDGRLYHPVVCELALEAYARRVKDRQRKEKWRNGKIGTEPSQNADGDGDKTGTEPFQNADGDVPETVLEQMTGQDRTGQEIKKERTSASHSATATPSPPDPPDARTEFWRDGLAIVRSLTGRPDGPSRAFLGRILKTLGDDCDAGLQVLHAAHDLRPGGPEAWIVAACEARATRKTTGISARKEKILRAGGLWPEDGTTIDATTSERFLIQ
jgi:hypothetical protein